MKSAIVLGLAVAASAQVDNELVSGADLVRNAGYGRSNPIGHRVPIDYNTQYLNKYGLTHDDAADDEMMVYYTKDSRGVNHYQGGYTRDDEVDNEMMVYYTKDSRGVNHYQGGYTRDDAADDELIIAPTDEFGNIKKYPRNVRFDEVADDEMMVYYTKDSRGVNHYQGGYTRDDAADDELVSLPYSPSGADLVKYAKQSQQTVYRPTAHVVRDDEADDEMMVYYTKDSRGVNHYQGGYTRDDAADDELVSLPYSPSGADLVKYAKQSQQTVYRPFAHVVRDDEADDEFMVYYTKDSRGVKHYEGGYTRDDADDELAYLGHLIKETAQPEKVEKKPEIKRKFRPVEKN